jgi:hypothetical protein
MMQRFSSPPQSLLFLSLLLLVLLDLAKAQFTCTLSARDEDSCLAAQDDDGSNCVWCSLSGFGFCVNEAAAEAAESTLPGISCDRAGPPGPPTPPATDDQASLPPATPSAPTKPHPKPPPPPPPKTDDDIKPNDDKKVPSNFWNCLKQKTAETCKAERCTWCKAAKAGGWNVCMTGPTAQSAKKSKFFKCDKDGEEEDEDEDADPEEEGAAIIVDKQLTNDASCLQAYLLDPTETGCTTSTDEGGIACEWCTLLNGMVNVCLTHDQAQQASAIGITCQPSSTSSSAVTTSSLRGGSGGSSSSDRARGGSDVRVPLSPALGLADEDDDGLYDPTCVLASRAAQGWGTPDPQDCFSARDASGRSCSYCRVLGGRYSVCLTSDQSQWVQSVVGESGDALLDCSDSHGDGNSNTADAVPHDQQVKDKDKDNNMDPYDPSCMVAYLQNPTEEGCDAAADSEGNRCEYCTISGFHVCLTIEQAQMSQGAGATCSSSSSSSLLPEELLVERDYQDMSCAEAYKENGGKASDDCFGGVDEDGAGCLYCTRDLISYYCLTPWQGDLLTPLGFWCDRRQNDVHKLHPPEQQEQDEEPIKEATDTGAESAAVGPLPDDFFQCLESYEPEGCTHQNGCTWCDSQVGIGFCASSAVAEGMKACTFFDCRYKTTTEATTGKDPTGGKEARDETSDKERIDGSSSGLSPFDASCMSTSFSHPHDDDASGAAACRAATDQAGRPCEWCRTGDGSVGLCFNHDQAARASSILHCDTPVADAVVAME